MRTLLFLHLVGVALLIVAFSVSMLTLLGLASARAPEDLRTATAFRRYAALFSAPGALLTVITGLWLVAQGSRWGWGDAWVIVSIVLTVLLSAYGPAVQAGRVRRAKTLAEQGDPGWQDASRDPVLHYVGWVALAQLVVLLFLMSVKPDVVGSLVAVAAGVVAGAAVAFWVLRPQAAAAKVGR
jgi:uncharacterized membrane protein